MAFNPIGNLPLGQFLQIAFTSGVFNQLNQTFPDFEMVKKFRVGDPNWREQRFMLQTSLGPNAVQYAQPSGTGSGAFPKAQRIGISEKTAVSKELDATVEIEYNLYKKALNSPLKYAEPLALEMQSKAVATKRRIAADLYADGTGVIGTVASAAVSGTRLVITLSDANAARGHVGLFEYGDLVVPRTAAGAAQLPDGAGIVALRVVARSRKNKTVTVEGVDANEVVINITGAGAVSSGDLVYRAGQVEVPDLSGSVADYGLISTVFPGFESLLANDGRFVHGIEMAGITGGTRVDCGAQLIALKYVQEALSEAKVAVGQGLYKWDMLAMSPEARDSLVEADEDKRRLTVSDSQRVKGAKAFIFQHENDTLEVVSSEYIGPKRAFALPKQAAGQKAMMQLFFTEMTPVDCGSGKLHLKPASGGGHERRIASYMEGQLALLCTHPAAGVVLENFTI